MSNIYQRIYSKLLTLAPELPSLKPGDYMKSTSNGFMDLNVDVLSEGKNSTLIIALSHYYKHSCGDMIADPDMEIRVFRDLNVAEALSFQDAVFYHVVYPDEKHVSLLLKKSLNGFLNTWLQNCIDQGHKLHMRCDKAEETDEN